MRRFAAILFLLGFLFIGGKSVRAQYYSWGADAAALRWKHLRTEDVRVVFPDTASALAHRTLYYIQAVRPTITHGFSHPPLKIPFVLHTENFQSNGLVMWMPKRIEFLTTPSVDSYSMPWVKQLVAHEYRHAVQYNNLNRGLIRILSYLIGQQGSTVGLLFMPLWALEGDAVMNETEMSSYGRGRQPRFTIEYRALGYEVLRRRNCDKWFCGSFRDFVPDHYQMGYQMVAYGYDRYGDEIWDKTLRYGVRNAYMLTFSTSVALRKFYGTGEGILFRDAFADLNRFWDSLPKVADSGRTLTPLPEKNYTTYTHPVSLNDTTLVALKTDFDRPSRLVAVDSRTGRERRRTWTGLVSSRPATDGQQIWWTEYRRSLLFPERVNSRLVVFDPEKKRPRTAPKLRNVLYPTPIGRSGALAWVEYTPDGHYTIVAEDSLRQRTAWPMPGFSEVHGLAWDNATERLYTLVTDDSGMWIGRIEPGEGLQAVTRGAYITLSDLRAADGKLYYGSIASGRDEAHCYDLMARREYRITTSAFGSFSPAPWHDAADGEGVLLTTYDRRGYRVAAQRVADSTLVPVAPSKLPLNVVNPERKRWDVVNLDTVRFTGADSLRQSGTFRARRYRKVPNLVNVHSWMPVAFNPFDAVDEHNINLNLGVTLLSQNLLSNTEAYASYGWNRNEGSLFSLGVRYFGLGVHLDLDASYGGNQLFYSLVSYDPQTGDPIYQKRPSPDKYYSIGLAATLPLYFQRGYHTRQLSLSAGWNYSNGMVADLGKIEWENGSISNIQRVGFREGLHKVSFGAGFSDQVRMAHRDIAPRWGYTLSANYTFNPENAHFSDLISFYGQAYLPGFAPHNSVLVAATYQTSIGGYKFPSGYAPLSYKSTRLVPRGFTSADIVSNNYAAFQANYQLPVWYPEGGIGSVIYIKRIRLNAGGDYAQFRDVGRGGMTWRRIWSVGGDIVFDFNAFRQPASATSTFKLSCYHPSSGGVYVAASVGLPF